MIFIMILKVVFTFEYFINTLIIIIEKKNKKYTKARITKLFRPTFRKTSVLRS